MQPLECVLFIVGKYGEIQKCVGTCGWLDL